MKRIGLAVCYDTKNFGSQLQVLATVRKIEELGYETEIIRYKKKWTPAFVLQSVPRLFNVPFIRAKLSTIIKNRKIKKYPDIQKNVFIRNERFKQFVDVHFQNLSTPYAGWENLVRQMQSALDTIPLYFLSLYNGGIDAQNTHFQSNKSQNELHFLKYSSIFSFWAKIKDRQFYNQRSNRSMELKSSFFPSEMILSFFSLYNANDNIIFRRETLSPTEMFNSYQKWFRKICFPQPCHSSSTHFSFIS